MSKAGIANDGSTAARNWHLYIRTADVEIVDFKVTALNAQLVADFDLIERIENDASFEEAIGESITAFNGKVDNTTKTFTVGMSSYKMSVADLDKMKTTYKGTDVDIVLVSGDSHDSTVKVGSMIAVMYGIPITMLSNIAGQNPFKLRLEGSKVTPVTTDAIIIKEGLADA